MAPPTTLAIINPGNAHCGTCNAVANAISIVLDRLCTRIERVLESIVPFATSMMSVNLTISNLDNETFRLLQIEAERCGGDVPSVASALLAEHLKSNNVPARRRAGTAMISTIWQAPGRLRRRTNSLKPSRILAVLNRKCGSEANSYRQQCLHGIQVRRIPMVLSIVQNSEIKVSVVVLGELLHGFQLGSREQRNREELAEVPASPWVKLVDIERAIAERYAKAKRNCVASASPFPSTTFGSRPLHWNWILMYSRWMNTFDSYRD